MVEYLKAKGTEIIFSSMELGGFSWTQHYIKSFIIKVNIKTKYKSINLIISKFQVLQQEYKHYDVIKKLYYSLKHNYFSTWAPIKNSQIPTTHFANRGGNGTGQSSLETHGKVATWTNKKNGYYLNVNKKYCYKIYLKNRKWCEKWHTCTCHNKKLR